MDIQTFQIIVFLEFLGLWKLKTSGLPHIQNFQISGNTKIWQFQKTRFSKVLNLRFLKFPEICKLFNSRILIIRNILHFATTFLLSGPRSHNYSLFCNCIWFCKCMWSIKSQSQIFDACSHIFLSHLIQFMHYLFGRDISFSYFIPIFVEIVYTCISILNDSVHEMLSDSYEYFTLKAILFLSHLWPLTYSMLGRYICFLKCLWSYKWHSLWFEIQQQYSFFQIIDDLGIPCWVVIFGFFANAYRHWVMGTNILHLAIVFVLSYLGSLMYSLFDRHFFLIYKNTFGIVHTCSSKHNVNAYEVLNDN